jgi:hypothetical protein
MALAILVLLVLSMVDALNPSDLLAIAAQDKARLHPN